MLLKINMKKICFNASDKRYLEPKMEQNNGRLWKHSNMKFVFQTLEYKHTSQQEISKMINLVADSKIVVTILVCYSYLSYNFSPNYFLSWLFTEEFHVKFQIKRICLLNSCVILSGKISPKA